MADYDNIPLDGLILWPSTHASIPSGWDRVTNYDEMFLQGADSSFAGVTSGAADGGATSHTHTVAGTHPHNTNSHSHNVYSNNASLPPQQTFNAQTLGQLVCVARHSHASTGSPTAAPAVNASAVAFDSQTTDTPLYLKFIVIEPDTTAKPIPNNSVVLFDDSTPPTDFAVYSALDTRHIIGADSSSGDGGGTGGAAPGHIHAQTGSGHKHSFNAHTHSPFTAAGGTTTWSDYVEDVLLRPPAHHTITPANATPADTGYNDDDSAESDLYPASVRLQPIQNTSGEDQRPTRGMIIGWKGAASSIPTDDGWLLCDGGGHTPFDLTDRQVKGWESSEGYSYGSTVGDNLHDHSIGHTHTTTAHNHGVSVNEFGLLSANDGTSRGLATSGHTHSAWTCTIASITIVSGSGSMSSEDTRRPYRELCWIWFEGSATVELRGTADLKGTGVIR